MVSCHFTMTGVYRKRMLGMWDRLLFAFYKNDMTREKKEIISFICYRLRTAQHCGTRSASCVVIVKTQRRLLKISMTNRLLAARVSPKFGLQGSTTVRKSTGLTQWSQRLCPRLKAQRLLIQNFTGPQLKLSCPYSSLSWLDLRKSEEAGLSGKALGPPPPHPSPAALIRTRFNLLAGLRPYFPYHVTLWKCVLKHPSIL